MPSEDLACDWQKMLITQSLPLSIGCPADSDWQIVQAIVKAPATGTAGGSVGGTGLQPPGNQLGVHQGLLPSQLEAWLAVPYRELLSGT
jgi:hypothetical protein